MNLKLDTPPRKVPLSRALRHRDAASSRERLCSKVWNRPVLKKKDCSLNFSWLSKCFKKYSEATSAAIIRLNPSHLSWLRSGAATRREQTSEKRLCMLKTHLKASACAERLADLIVSDCSLKADFTLLLYHQQPSSKTAEGRQRKGMDVFDQIESRR